MKIRLGRSDYTVTKEKMHPDEAGECDHINKTIKIRKDLYLRDSLLTYIHEIVHGECAENGIRQTPGWTLDKEELLCENISYCVMENVVDILPKLKKLLK